MSKDFNQYQPVVLKTVLKKVKILDCKFSKKRQYNPYKHQKQEQRITQYKKNKKEKSIFIYLKADY
jgi:uncharacterized Fe-S cluster-containing protein